MKFISGRTMRVGLILVVGVLVGGYAVKPIFASNPPTITDVGTVLKINAAQKALIPVSGTATDGEAISVVLTDSAGVPHTASTTVVAAGGYSVTLDGSAFVDGAVTASVTSNDGISFPTAPVTAVATLDATLPVVTQVTPVTTPTNNTTPSYTFNSTEAGAITYGGGCTASGFPTAAVGSNTITFDTLASGSHSCTIVVKDSFGNDSATLNASAFVVDTQAPTLASLKVTGPNQITAVFSEVVTAAQTDFSDAKGGFGVRNVTGITGSGSTTIVITVDGAAFAPDAVGTIDIGAGVKDAANNFFVALNDTVVTDGQAPALTIVSIASNNTNSARATTGNVVTLSFTSNEAVSTPTVTIEGAAVVPTGGPTIWTATRTMLAGDAQGVVPFTIDFADLATNAGPQKTTTIGGSSVAFDNVAPVVTLSLPFTNSFVRASSLVTFTDGEQTSPQCSVTGGSFTACLSGITTLGDLNGFTAVPQGAFTLTLSDTDPTGNVGTVTRSLFKDTIAPTAPGTPTAAAGLLINSSEQAAGFTVVVPITGSGAVVGDTLELLVNGVSFPASLTAILNGTEVAPAGTHTFTVAAGQLGTDGLKNITARVTDQAGNVGAQSAALALTLDTAAPTITSVTSATANGAYKAGTVIPVTVTFNEPVTSAGVTLTFNTTGTAGTCTTAAIASATTGSCNYTVAAGQTSADLDAVVTGPIADDAGNTLTNFTPATTLATSKDIIIDTTAPTVVSVTTAKADGFYTTGATVDLTLVMSEPVVVTGTPKIAVNTGAGGTNFASFVSGSGTNTLTLTYTVGAGHNSADFDYDDPAAFGVAGTITDAATNAANRTLPAVPNIAAAHAIVIDTTAPTATNLPTAAAGPSITAAESTAGFVVNVPLGTSGAVAGDTVTLLLGGSNFPTPLTRTLTAGDIASASTTFTVASGQLGADGVKNITARVTDQAGNVGAQSAALALTLDTVLPTITSVTSTTASGSYKAGVVIPLTVTFSEAVNSAVGVTLTVNTTGTAGTCTTAAIAAATTGTCNYTVAAGQTSADLDAVVTGVIADVAGNTLTNFTPATTLATSKDIIVDTTAPLVSSLTTAKQDGFYKVGATIDFAVAFPENVFVVSGTPQLQLNSGGFAFLVSGSGTNTLTLRYTVGAGDTSVDLDYALASSLTGNVTDLAGNVAPLTLAPPGAIAAGHNIVIDTTAPAATKLPTAVAGPFINAAENTAGFAVVAPLATTGSLAVAGDTLELLVNGAPFPTPLTRVLTAGDIAAGSFSFNVASGQLGADGAKNITSRVTDQALNVGTASPALALTLDTVAPLAPVLTAVAGDNRINNAEKAAISVTGSAEANALVSATLADTAGSSKASTQQLTLGATAYSFTFNGTTAAPLAFIDGVITPTITATDAAGNVSNPTVLPGVVQDTIAPAAPVVALTNPVNIANVASSAVTGTGEGNTTISVSVTDGTLTVSATGTTTAPGIILVPAINLSTLAQGTLTATVTLADAAGNVSIAGTASATKDTVTPVFSAVTPPTNAFINNVTTASLIGFTLSEKLSAGTTTITRTGGAADATTHVCVLAGTAKNAGAHTLNLSDTVNGCTSAQTLVDGAIYTMTFVGSDLVGNPSVTTTRTGITFDITPPAITVNSPLPFVSTPTSLVAALTTSEAATCTMTLDGATSAFTTTGGTAHSKALSALSLGVHTLTTSCTDPALNNTVSPSQTFTVLATSGSSLTATTSNPAFTSAVVGQADIPSGIDTLNFNNTNLLDLSLNTQAATGGNITFAGVTQSLSSVTTGALTAVNLSTPRTVGDQTTQIAKAVTISLTGGSESSVLTLVNQSLPVTAVLTIPNGTTVFGPSTWDGTLQPARLAGATTGNAPSGFVAGDEMVFGAAQNLFFSKAATITVNTIAPIAFKPAASSNWFTVGTCAGTFASPTVPAFSEECVINNGVDSSKIVTFHLTSFGTLTPAIPDTGNGLQKGPVFGGGGGGGGGSFTLFSPTKTTTVTPTTTTAPTTPGTTSTGTVLGVKTFRFTRDLSQGLRGADVMELQKRLAAEGFFKVTPTTLFGPATKAAVKLYQAKHKVSATGTVGPLTRGMLNK